MLIEETTSSCICWQRLSRSDRKCTLPLLANALLEVDKFEDLKEVLKEKRDEMENALSQVKARKKK